MPDDNLPAPRPDWRPDWRAEARRNGLARLQVAGIIFTIAFGGPLLGWILTEAPPLARILTLLALVAIVTGVVWGRTRDRWRGWQPPAGMWLDRRPTGFVPPRRISFVQRGNKVRNLLQGTIDGHPWGAWEQSIGPASWEWRFSLQLARPVPHWLCESALPGGWDSGLTPAASTLTRANFSPSLPPAVKSLLDSTMLDVTFETVDEELVATVPTMKPSQLETWLGNQGALLVAIADAIDEYTARPAFAAAQENPALPPANPSRNVWQAPEVDVDPTPAREPRPGWHQPAFDDRSDVQDPPAG